MRLPVPVVASVLTLLISCGGSGPPPSVTLVTPVNDAVVSGTAALQATLDEGVTGEVRLYARRRDGQEDGQFIGSANNRPYLVRWNTTAFPNGSDLEVYARAIVDGSEGRSAPVRVTIQNASAPQLRYMVGYNVPASFTAQSLTSGPRGLIDPLKVRGPDATQAVAGHANRKVGSVGAQAAGQRSFWAEWGWTAVPGAYGYRVLMADRSLAGPYSVVKSPLPSNGAVTEKHSMPLPDGAVAGKVYGVVRSVSSAQVESALSNAGTAVLMDAQQVASPVDGQVVQDGRPILTWNALQGASGYFYSVCDRPCTDPLAREIWGNTDRQGQAITPISELSAVYPADQEPLVAGTYYWWIAAVRLEGGRPVSLSYSELRRLVVP
ncbi:Ig-like domain-containing protein [Deinococcus sp. JMULE3]|uniref:Ig-like domain-containing protein n=1 Tax=Deinococcus sp. JMULE3 TaxID=2518341 RepID=UPI001575B8D7|nr:Ig-like domain-containing protein [Deinococcus sp. JMULE3]NTX99532.1 hypothetical protein [Deinococcus sp. JMULE3]